MSQDVKCAKDQLTIINCSKTYQIPKKLLGSKIPYFEGLLSGDFKESKENKVSFEFDEHIFELLIDWINGFLRLKIDSVIDLYDLADYLMVEDLKISCYNFFYENFTIDDLQVVLNQVTETSKLINIKNIDSFISRNFLKIVNLKSFLNFSLTTLEYVFKLDLWIDSEFDIFKAITIWIDHDVTSRKQHLTDLLTLIRWNQLSSDDVAAIYDHKYTQELKEIDNDPSFSTQSGLSTNSRAIKTSLLSIYTNLNDTKNIAIFEFKSGSWNLIGTFSEDLNIPTHIICGDTAFDIFYDSGRRAIRVNWPTKTFCYLGTEIINYYRLMLLKTSNSKFSTGYSHFYKWKDGALEGSMHYDALLESKGKFILLCREPYDLNNIHCCWPAKVRQDFKRFAEYLIQGAVVGNDVYAYSRGYKSKLIRFSKDSGKIIDLTLPQKITAQSAFKYERCGISQGRARCLRGKVYVNYLLSSYGSQLVLGIKSSKEFFFYDPETNWNLYPMNYNGDLIGLTSVYWPINYNYVDKETLNESK